MIRNPTYRRRARLSVVLLLLLARGVGGAGGASAEPGTQDVPATPPPEAVEPSVPSAIPEPSAPPAAPEEPPAEPEPAEPVDSIPPPTPAGASAPGPAVGATAEPLPGPTLEEHETALRAAPDDLFLGADYRQRAIAEKAYDRPIAFLKELIVAHPDCAALELNLGYAYVDKIPAVGAITAVIVANTALGHFTRALELEETWLVRYTRGNSYLYWPPIFGRTELGIADLERAIALAAELPSRPYHARAWAALGDAQWRLGKPDEARKIWTDAADRYPGDPELEARLAREGQDLDAFLEEHFAVGTRVETHLREMREAPAETPVEPPAEERVP